MASKALPLLLLGGAALLMMSRKKGETITLVTGEIVDGQRLDGFCEGITTVNSAEWMNAFMEYWNANELEDQVTIENVEELLAGKFRQIFPQCEWPPDGDFKVNDKSWSQIIETMRKMLASMRSDAELPEGVMASERSENMPQAGASIGRALGGY